MTEAALTTFPLAPVRVAATLLMLSALVSVPRPVMLPKLPAAIWAFVIRHWRCGWRGSPVSR